ncbi:MAG: hypothetical protein ACKVQU_19090 [Burkholderiales bacterium]
MAICVLGGAARIVDAGSDVTITGTSGAWWFVETGTPWSLENAATDSAAELLVIRGTPGL